MSLRYQSQEIPYSHPVRASPLLPRSVTAVSSSRGSSAAYPARKPCRASRSAPCALPGVKRSPYSASPRWEAPASSHRLVQLAGEQVAFYNGSNPLALAAFVAGARGGCTAAPHLIPELNVQLYEAIERKDLARARALFYRQLPLLQFIVKHGLPRAIWAGLELTGTRVGPLRAPLLPLEAPQVEELRRILVTLEVLRA